MNFETFYSVLCYVSALSVLVPISLFIALFKNSNRVSIVLFVYLVISLASEIAQYILVNEKIITTTIYNIFSLCEFILISIIYFYALEMNKPLKRWFFLSLILYVVFIFWKGDVRYPMDTFKGLYASLIIIYTLNYFYKENEEMRVAVLTDHYFFWFNCAFLLYFGLSLFILLWDGFIMSRDDDVTKILWIFQLFTNMVYYGILTIGIWKLNAKQH